jgi:hypothetical protein
MLRNLREDRKNREIKEIGKQPKPKKDTKVKEPCFTFTNKQFKGGKFYGIRNSSEISWQKSQKVTPCISIKNANMLSNSKESLQSKASRNPNLPKKQFKTHF